MATQSNSAAQIPLRPCAAAAVDPSDFRKDWNAENQLTKVEKNGIEQARFAYDPLGRRVEKAAAGVATNYTYDSANVISERRGASTLKYVHGSGIDEPLSVEDGAAVSYFHADALASIVQVSDVVGIPLPLRRYDAWGNMEVGGGQSGHAFGGREWDAEIGLYFNRARYYDPKIARFVSEDPIGFDGLDLTRYAYVQNRPTVLTDPTGLAGMKPQTCKGFGSQGHVCCEGGKLVPCVPPGKGPHHECLIEHEQWHIDDCNAQRAGESGPECSGRPCEPVACGTDECGAHRAQWDCLRRKGVSAHDAAYVKKSAEKKGCNTTGWRK